MLLWIPGPTQVREELLAELTRPMIGHRSEEMAELIERTDPGLRLAFGTLQASGSTVGVGTHSATAMMEGSLHGAGPQVLCVVNGAFSKRWAEIARTLGRDVTVLEVEWGDAVTPERLGSALAAGPGGKPFDAVTLVVNETSTGVRTPLGPLAPVLSAHPETLLLVDVVSGIAGFPIDFDKNRVDFALAGINKALALPPGLTVMCASARYMERARARRRPVWYLDPVRTLEGHAARKTPTTPCIPLYRALARQLEDIGAGRTLSADERGLEGEAAWRARFAKHERMKARAIAWARGHGIETFPPERLSSETVGCFRAGALDVPSFVTRLAEAGHRIGAGYGPLKRETFRIGHMGDHDEAGLEELLAAADRLLAQ